jgi:acetolactate synthase-1/2/3 large subunit
MSTELTREQSRWLTVEADEVADEIVAAMAANGIEFIFFSSGWEIAFFQEAIAKARARGRVAPRIITMTHEHAGLNAALGYAAVTGKPAATAVHVDAGTLHQGGAIHTAWHSALPVLLVAGGAPTSYAGSRRGARDSGSHIWKQDSIDQNGIQRQYTKWDHRLEHHDNAGLIVSRAMQIAMTEPPGPVYLTIPKEVALETVTDVRFPTVATLGLGVPPAANADAVADLARRLVAADVPVLIVAESGRDPRTVPALVALCELAGIAVVGASGKPYLNFPMRHPLNAEPAVLERADVVVMLEAVVPWIPGRAEPPPDAFLASIDRDPIKSRIAIYEFCADLRIVADPLSAIEQLTTACRALMNDAQRERAGARNAAYAQAAAQRWEADAADARSRAASTPVDPIWLSFQIGEALGDECIIFDETIEHNRLRAFLKLARPGSYFNAPGTSGGWSPGAALGAKLADPSRDVVAITGDGFYMYSTANAALWAARQYAAPYLTIVYQNRSYSTGTLRLASTFEHSYGVAADCEGGYFDPPLDFSKEAEAAGAYAENVDDPAEIAPAIARGLAATRSGRAAVISVWLPRLLHDT